MPEFLIQKEAAKIELCFNKMYNYYRNAIKMPEGQLRFPTTSISQASSAMRISAHVTTH